MKILVLGAGKMGRGAVHDLAHNSPDVTEITVADADFPLANFIAKLEGNGKCTPQEIDVENFAEAVELMRGHDTCISCVPYFYNMLLAEAALEARVNFCDLGGNNTIVAQELSLDQAARQAGINIIPDCGLAPGMVSVLATHGAERFDTVDSIKIRVGGLPQNPKPPLDYQLVFSIEGLINEYVERAIVIRDGEITVVESMTETESLEFEGFPPLEAFQTSGGTSTLPQTFLGRVRELDYKTIRYRGHCERFKTLIDLGFADSAPVAVRTAANDTVQVVPRRFLSDWLVRHLPRNEPDLVLIRLEFAGEINGENKILRYDIIDRFEEATELTAMMRTTAFPASIVGQMMARAETLDRGAMPQESVIPPAKFIEELARRNIKIQESWII
jgi:lysine 6-dehydrogenase